MNIMDHDQAIKQRAAERYLLDELSPEERNHFEEHYFMCVQCADDVRAAFAFRDNAKAVFKHALVRKERGHGSAGSFLNDIQVAINIGFNVETDFIVRSEDFIVADVMPAEMEIKRAGIWETRPLPIVRIEYV